VSWKISGIFWGKIVGNLMISFRNSPHIFTFQYVISSPTQVVHNYLSFYQHYCTVCLLYEQLNSVALIAWLSFSASYCGRDWLLVSES